jgi:hypothetical protein
MFINPSSVLPQFEAKNVSGYRFEPEIDAQWCRNLLWITPATWESVRAAQLMVVGCGGLGAQFVIQASHVGFRRFILCDPDIVTPDSFNRYVIATHADLAFPKVEVLRRYVESHFPGSSVMAIELAFPNVRAIQQIGGSTAVIGCVDDIPTRIQLDVACRKHGRPLVDLGTGFQIDDVSGGVTAGGGQVLISVVGGACLLCMGFTPGLLGHDYYLPGRTTPEPSSILLNTVCSAIAVEQILRGIPDPEANCIRYDRATMTLSRGIVQRRFGCRVCSELAAPHIASVSEWS